MILNIILTPQFPLRKIGAFRLLRVVATLSQSPAISSQELKMRQFGASGNRRICDVNRFK